VRQVFLCLKAVLVVVFYGVLFGRTDQVLFRQAPAELAGYPVREIHRFMQMMTLSGQHNALPDLC
jgi:hypothetical protein